MFVVGGESLIDLVPETRAAGSRRIAHPGGSPYNCAIALSKLGNDTGFLCPISTDAFGDTLLVPLAEAGVAVLIEQRVVAPTTTAEVSFNDKMQASYKFTRGAERAFSRAALLAALPQDLGLYQTGGFCPIEPEDAAIWLEVVDAAIGRGAVISVDVNWRDLLVTDRDGYIGRLNGFLNKAHLIKVSDEDLAHFDPALSIEQHIEGLLARPNCKLVVVTLGEGGSLAFTAQGRGKAEIWSPPVFGDTVGAGDSLMAGILTWLDETGVLKPGALGRLDDAALAKTLRFGAVVAGLNCGQIGCKPPTRQEVDAVLGMP
ncbi:carbohydrate kinase [uncultured Devosia sp.]|uniref:carbohydrate kinase family protein n=1 Tax=uncultured Devosia sp. TaxID=211434 RepID=UPI0035CA05B4